MKRSFWLSAATVVGLLWLSPSQASADNTYTVFSCKDVAANAATGWVGGQSGAGATTNTCAAGGALSAVLNGPKPGGDSSATWQFDAPAGTRIVRFAARRTTTGLLKSTQANDMSYVLETDNALLERCAPSADSACISDLTDRVEKEGLNGGFVHFRALCTNAGGTCSGPLRVDASQLSVGLQDVTAPVVTDVNPLDTGDASGILSVGFNATDVGGGLYRAIIKVDGKPLRTMQLSTAPCADVLPTDADPYQFNVPVPCLPALNGGRIDVDVKTLTPGPHGVAITLEDAAGNESAVFGPVEFPKLNIVAGSSIPAADLIRGTLKMWFVKAPKRGTHLTSRLGTRVVTRGVLKTPAGKGIQGARIDVYHLRDGKRRLLKTGLKSRAGGKLTLILPLNVDTRHIEFVYRAVRPGPATSKAKLRLRVYTRGGRLYHRK